MRKHRFPSTLLIITLIGGALRFYNLMWGNGFFFHPDERNMAISITKLCFNLSSLLPRTSNLEPRTVDLCSMNPHFYAYGQFPTYLAYFSYQIITWLHGYMATWLPLSNIQTGSRITPVPFPSAVLSLRFWSALVSTLTIPLVYFLVKELVEKRLIKRRAVPVSKCSENLLATKLKTLLKQTSKFSKREVLKNKQLLTEHRSRVSSKTRYASLLPLTAALFTAFTPGLIQAAHFGTTESLLTFFFMLIIYLSLKFLKTKKIKWLLLSAITSGIALGTKLSAAFFLVPPILTIFLSCFQSYKFNTKTSDRLPLCYFSNLGKLVVRTLVKVVLLVSLTLVVFLLTSPYNFLALNDFLGTSAYETRVAQGKSPVFYTEQFTETTPIVYQLTRIFPYALGWPIFLLGLGGLVLTISKLFSKPFLKLHQALSQAFNFDQRSHVDFKCLKELILILAFLIYFLPNAFLFTKWTRFITPIFPFFAIFGSIAAVQIFNVLKKVYQKAQSAKLKAQNYSLKLKTFNFLTIVFSFSLLALTLIPGLLFFTIYLKPDIRIEASEWIHQNIPDKTYVLSETANVVDIPITPQSFLNPRTYQVISFNFYDLDVDLSLLDKLTGHLEKADYVFVPSHRIFDSRLRLSEKYPLTAQYYRLLFSGNLGFEKVVHFSRLPDEKAEETWSVFDHPAVRIYKKIRPFSKKEYRNLLEKLGLEI